MDTEHGPASTAPARTLPDSSDSGPDARELTISSEGTKTMAKQTEVIERTPLTADQIESAASLFTPSDGDIHGRVLWIIKATESTNGNATAVAGDVEKYYQLQGRKAPRGYGRASIVNAGTDAKLWERTGCGNATAVIESGEGKSEKVGARQLVGALDAARHAHGAKTVQKLIDATAESLQTEVTPAVRLTAMLTALRALIDAPEVEKDTPPSVPTFSTFVKRAAALREYANSIPDDAWQEGIDALSDEDRDTLAALRAILGNATGEGN